MARFTTIPPSTLMRLLGTPHAPEVIDVRIDSDFDDDPRVIPTARRRSHDDIALLAETLAGKRVVVSCQKGRKLSHGAAALLRSFGIAAETLDGGHHAWRDAGLPLVADTQLPKRGALWVTRHRPKIDRVACPWLIRRFVDPTARFLFVPPADVMDVGERFNAIPFDVPNAPWTHAGDRCTFDAMVTGFSLSHEPLDRMAQVIRAADTNRHDLAPEAAGLLAISVGMSRAYSDDLEQLEAGMPLYDALYRWARDGQSETHDWDADRAS